MGDRSYDVLVVDDDEDEVELVAEYLSRTASEIDCRVTVETDPEAALERVRSGDHFDCVVSDSTFPAMDGIDFLEAVREHRPSVARLLFACDEPGDVAARIVEAGVTDYLRKGLGSEQYTMLVRRVTHALGGTAGSFDPDRDVELSRVAIVGADGRFESVDEGYASLYGYTAAEVMGRYWADLHPMSAVEHIQTNVAPVVGSGGQWSGRSEGLRADGSTFVESKLVQSLSDGRLLIAVSVVDTTTE